MRILLTGASGFIGRHVAERLEAAGHELVRVSRRPPAHSAGWLALDLGSTPASEWQPHLQGIDMVVNAVGIFRENEAQTFSRLHFEGPKALFEACSRAGVRRVIQVSALGADEHARSGYHLSKRAGDEALLESGLDACVLQPSLVYGLDGESSRVFLQWAALPVLAVPEGAGAVQPVHVDDLAEVVLKLVEGARSGNPRLAVVGPAALRFEDYLQALRRGMGLRPARVWRIPRAWMSAAARVGDWWRGSLFDKEAWGMLQRGNAAPVDEVARVLGREPRPPGQFIAPAERDVVLSRARLGPGLMLLRWSLAAVWTGTAIVSAGAYPVADSLALLERVGATGTFAWILLYGAAALDLLLGLATLFWPRRLLWWGQIVLIVVYSGLIAWRLPEYWLHPYGPMLKNLPILAGLGLLLALEGRRT